MERLVASLEEAGHNVFYSRKSIKGAQQWHDEIGAALARCSWFVLVLTPESVKSEWVKRELVHVLQEPQYSERIVPALFRSCDIKKLSWTLSAYQQIDFRRNFAGACLALLDRLGPGR